jgi:hypothetical protein
MSRRRIPEPDVLSIAEPGGRAAVFVFQACNDTRGIAQAL